jgi:hypothetical protein
LYQFDFGVCGIHFSAESVHTRRLSHCDNTQRDRLARFYASDRLKSHLTWHDLMAMSLGAFGLDSS